MMISTDNTEPKHRNKTSNFGVVQSTLEGGDHHDNAPSPAPSSSPPMSSSFHGSDLDLFRIDSGDGDNDNENNDSYENIEIEGLPSVSSSTNNDSECLGEQQHDTTQDHHDALDDSSHTLYTTPVDVDFAEATVVAPADLTAGSILRVYLGRHRILVVEVPPGGVKAGSTFTAPYRIHQAALSPLEQFRIKSYEDGHYHGWMAKFFGCCEFGPFHPSFVGAFLCPCALLLEVMGKLHLNWYGKYSFPTSPSNRQSGRRNAIACVVLTYLLTIILNSILIGHVIFTKVYNSKRGNQLVADAAEYIFNQSKDGRSDENVVLDGEASIYCGSNHDNEVECNHHSINMPLVISIIVIDAILFSYILVLFTRTRSAVRDHHFIHGGTMQDCFLSCLCHCCVLSQLARESYECEGRREPRLFYDGLDGDDECMEEMNHLYGNECSHDGCKLQESSEVV